MQSPSVETGSRFYSLRDYMSQYNNPKMAAKYQYSKLVMEKFLRRSFYDAVLELYETSQGTRIISVSLEGNLTLVVNKDEHFLIKLNEVAQRADDREDNLRYSKAETPTMKVEGFDQYAMKKEENNVEQFSHIPIAPLAPDPIAHDIINEGINNYKVVAKEYKDRGESSKLLPTHYIDNSKFITKPCDAIEGKINGDSKAESDSYEKSSETESESEEEVDADIVSSHHNHHIPPQLQPETSMMYEDKNSHNYSSSVASTDEICFVPEPQFMDYNKRKFDFKDQEQSQLLSVEQSGKKSPHKKRKVNLIDCEEDLSKLEERDKLASTASTGMEDSGSGGPQLLPHTATGPIIVEDEDNFNNGITESQMAQLAMMQMREQNINMFRPQDLEELARQQQQWQMVAYQRSIMEKSYLQHHMQQYQRDTAERLRWEYVTHQARDFPQTGEEVEKAYKQTPPTQNSTNSETVILANTSTLADEAKKPTSRESNVDLSSVGMENIPSQYMRMFSEDPSVSQSQVQVENDYEEGELRPEVHNCALCGTKYSSMDSLLRHMEKHRVAFERSCNVCQLGTLTGNMLILHMEASHGPDASFPLPSSAPSTNTIASSLDTSTVTSVAVAATDYAQFFSTPSSSTSSTGFTGLSEQPSGVKLSQQQQQQQHHQQPLSSIQAVIIKEPPKSDTPTDPVKSEMLPLGFNYPSSTASSITGAATDATASSSSNTSQDNLLGLPSQFYPLIVCQVCGEKFALSEALDQHVDANHKDAALTYSCKVCPLTFPKHVELSKHITKHESSSTNLKCSHCLKSFKSVKQLRLHYVAAHACCHFCEYCRAGFPDAMALQLHEQLHTLDPEKLTFRCDICNKAFYTQSQCSAHKRTHKEEKAHICELCGSAFFKRGDLTKHTRTVHLPSRLFACKFCGKKGTRMDNMRSHVKSHHKNMSRDQIINMIEVIE